MAKRSLDLAALRPYLLGAAIGGLAAVVLGHFLPCPVPLKRLTKKAYVLAVRITLVPGTIGAFTARWAAMAAVCRSSAEPNCLSYEMCVSEEDPNTILIYERYVAREDLSITHRNTAAFKAFGKWLNEESGLELLGDGRKSIVRAPAFPPRASPGPISQFPIKGAATFSSGRERPSSSSRARRRRPSLRTQHTHSLSLRQVVEKSNCSYYETNVGHMVR
jgi:quinol monooxygenase YgiN